MFIKELFEGATHEGYLDLQALIMFLVFEKQVLSMEDDTRELDRYFSERHNEKMNKLLAEYKRKMNMSYGLQAYEMKSDRKTVYIAAYSEKQARYIAENNLMVVDQVRICSDKELMTYKDKNVTMGSILKGRKAGILGEF